jgi:hypothetical protein
MSLLNLILFVGFSWAISPTLTTPEFECLAIHPVANARVEELFGTKTLPFFSLRKFSDGKWLYKSNRLNQTLDAAVVSKITDIFFTKVKYRIREKRGEFLVDLSGTPPSRQGKLWEIGKRLTKDRLLAEVTCH